MALSVASGERIIMAAEAGDKIPLGCCVDKFGNPTDDPRAKSEDYFQQGLKPRLSDIGGS